MAKDARTARDALFLMNSQLRLLRLNMQGAKTQVLQGEEIRAKLLDDRFIRVNAALDAFQKSGRTASERVRCRTVLRKEARSIRVGKRGVPDADMRLFRRLLAGFGEVDDSGMVPAAMRELGLTADNRLIGSALRYLRGRTNNRRRIADRLTELTTTALFPYQEGHLLRALRYVREIPDLARRHAWRRVQQRRAHWYVRQEAARLLAQSPLTQSELRVALDRFHRERDSAVKRAWLHALAQLDRPAAEELARGLAFSLDPKLQRVGWVFTALLYRKANQAQHIDAMFRVLNEDALIERLYELELIAKAKDVEIRQRLFRALASAVPTVRRPRLRQRLARLQAFVSGAKKQGTADD